MNSLPLATIMSHRHTSGEAFSALPDAPVIDHVEPVPAAAPRTYGDSRHALSPRATWSLPRGRPAASGP